MSSTFWSPTRSMAKVSAGLPSTSAQYGLFRKAVAYRGDVTEADARAVVAADQRELLELAARYRPGTRSAG
jgi:hypothetical protein